MAKKPSKKKGPNMPLIIGLTVTAVLIAIVVIWITSSKQGETSSLKSTKLHLGMPKQEAEELLGKATDTYSSMEQGQTIEHLLFGVDQKAPCVQKIANGPPCPAGSMEVQFQDGKVKNAFHLDQPKAPSLADAPTHW